MVSRMRARQGQRGFTLTELLLALAVMGGLAAVAVPGMGNLIDNQRVRGASTDLFTALMRTRSEAIRRNTEVTLVPVTAGHWQDGWSIPDPTNSAVTFESHGAIPKAVIAGPDSVVYLGNGRIKGTSAPRFDLSGGEERSRRCIKVDLSGRPLQLNKRC